jgi:hypothetical protein
MSRIRCNKAAGPQISRQQHGSMLPYGLLIESSAPSKRGAENPCQVCHGFTLNKADLPTISL